MVLVLSQLRDKAPSKTITHLYLSDNLTSSEASAAVHPFLAAHFSISSGFHDSFAALSLAKVRLAFSLSDVEFNQGQTMRPIKPNFPRGMGIRCRQRHTIVKHPTIVNVL